jgi:hypothetical protein
LERLSAREADVDGQFRQQFVAVPKQRCGAGGDIAVPRAIALSETAFAPPWCTWAMTVALICATAWRQYCSRRVSSCAAERLWCQLLVDAV